MEGNVIRFPRVPFAVRAADVAAWLCKCGCGYWVALCDGRMRCQDCGYEPRVLRNHVETEPPRAA